MLDVSIIIVNYNVKYFVEQCLWSIDASRGQLKIEILVVDNASQDGSLEYLKPRFPEVKFISNIENIGFGRANNLALAQASGRYLLVLNPDTLLGEDTLSVDTFAVITFPDLGDFTVNCTVSDSTGFSDIQWDVHVREFTIRNFEPANLALALQRGTSVNFVVEIETLDEL